MWLTIVPAQNDEQGRFGVPVMETVSADEINVASRESEDNSHTDQAVNN